MDNFDRLVVSFLGNTKIFLYKFYLHTLFFLIFFLETLLFEFLCVILDIYSEAKPSICSYNHYLRRTSRSGELSKKFFIIKN